MSSDACDFYLETPLAGMPQDKHILSFNIWFCVKLSSLYLYKYCMVEIGIGHTYKH